MAGNKTHPFQMRVTPDWLERIDEWRRTQEDIPSRAEAIRRLVDLGLAVPAAKLDRAGFGRVDTWHQDARE